MQYVVSLLFASYLLFSNYSTYVCSIFSIFVFLFCVFPILCILCFCIVLCIVSLFVYCCLFPVFIQLYRPLPTEGNPIAINKIISYQYNVLYRQFVLFLRIVLTRGGPSQWPCGLRRRSAAARVLRLWVRIPPEARMFVGCQCCVLSGRGRCDGLIIRLEEAYRLWCVVVCDLETSSRKSRPWPALGSSAIAKNINIS